MPGNNYFQFKQFKIIQEKAAMRVGTDGVLLGAWANIHNAKKILDVGTGTGLIALMLAQRCDAQITGIEIEKNAADEATQNVYNSPWKNRINIKHISFQEFSEKTSDKFDLIVSNPPFFMNDKPAANSNKNIARHSEKLSLYDLIKGSEKLLSADGFLSLILPILSAEKFIKLAKKYRLFLAAHTAVKPREDKNPNRYLMEFRRNEVPFRKNYIAIRESENNDFTTAFKTLTRDYYLKF